MGKKPSLLLFIILFGAMFLFGYIENIKGVSYPLIKTDFGISYEQQGVFVSILSFSYVLFCLLGGILIARLGVKATFTLGFIFMALGLGAAFFFPSFLLAASALFVVSASFGLFEVSSNALATQIFQKKPALLMSLMHFFYGAGSSVSPRAAGTISLAMSWRHVYLFSLPLVLLLFIPSLFARFPGTQHPEGGAEEKKATFYDALKTPAVWYFALTLGLMVGVELASPNWGGLYFQDVHGLDPQTLGAAFISNFYILFTLSRLASGFGIEKIGYDRSLILACCMVLVIFILGFALGPRGIRVLPFLGFFTAIFWPTLMALAMGHFRQNSPVMTSAVIVIAGGINSLMQFLIGYTNRLAGPQWGYRSCFVYALLSLGALLLLKRHLRAQSKAPA